MTKEEMATKLANTVSDENVRGLIYHAFIIGYGKGRKGAIKESEEWMKYKDHFYQGGSERCPEVLTLFDTMDEMFADYRQYMNKKEE